MQAISASRIGVDAADRAERGLGPCRAPATPFATLGAIRSSFASLPAQGGEGGQGRVVKTPLHGRRAAARSCPTSPERKHCRIAAGGTGLQSGCKAAPIRPDRVVRLLGSTGHEYARQGGGRRGRV